MGTLSLVEAAIRAPSSHNTQPWLFRARKGAVELFADRTRALPVNDPFDRELTISCGAALLTLEAAAARAGLGVATTLLPEPQDPDHLATVALEGEPDTALALLAEPIERRRTTRKAFEERPLPDGLVAELAEPGEAHAGCWLRLVDDPAHRAELARLVGEGDHAQFADPRWRRELAAWMHPRRKGDGLTVSELTGPGSRTVVRALDVGASVAGADERLVRDAPRLVLLGSRRDEPRAWLETGRLLQTVLLRCAARDVQAGYLNQPCQVAELRPRLQRALDAPGLPQLVLRLGHAPAARRPSPRRPVADVLLDGPSSER